MNIIHNMRVVNNHALQNRNKYPKKYLQMAEREKKKNYAESFLKQCPNFSPFAVSVYGLIDVEAEATLKNISGRLGTKWNQPYLRTCSYVNIRVVTTLVCVTHNFIWESWVPAHKITVQRPQWEYGAGLHILRYRHAAMLILGWSPPWSV